MKPPKSEQWSKWWARLNIEVSFMRQRGAACGVVRSDGLGHRQAAESETKWSWQRDTHRDRQVDRRSRSVRTPKLLMRRSAWTNFSLASTTTTTTTTTPPLPPPPPRHQDWAMARLFALSDGKHTWISLKSRGGEVLGAGLGLFQHCVAWEDGKSFVSSDRSPAAITSTRPALRTIPCSWGPLRRCKLRSWSTYLTLINFILNV